MESLSNFRIYSNIQILINGDFGISFINFRLHPVSKLLSYNGIDNIDDELLWELKYFLLIWQSQHDLRDCSCLLKDFSHLETIVLRAVEVLDCIALDELLSTRDKIFQKIYSHVLVRGKVSFAIDGQEVPYFYILGILENIL